MAVRQLRWGDKVRVVNNPEGKTTPPFKKFVRGQPATYRVEYVTRHSIETRLMDKNGGPSLYYYFTHQEVLPEWVEDKGLEEYL